MSRLEFEPRIKVCGLTTAAEVEDAVRAGAEAIGFVHHAPSRRSLSLEGAAELSAHLRELAPRTRSVLVTVDADPDVLAPLAESCGLGGVQLCGREDPAAWAGFPTPLLRRVAVETRAPSTAGPEFDRWACYASAFVLDHPGGPGGLGTPVDLERAARLVQSAPLPCLLAGGLGPENARELIRQVRPAGVDASSRLERRGGLKDAMRVLNFVSIARTALRGLATAHPEHGAAS